MIIRPDHHLFNLRNQRNTRWPLQLIISNCKNMSLSKAVLILLSWCGSSWESWPTWTWILLSGVLGVPPTLKPHLNTSCTTQTLLRPFQSKMLLIWVRYTKACVCRGVYFQCWWVFVAKHERFAGASGEGGSVGAVPFEGTDGLNEGKEEVMQGVEQKTWSDAPAAGLLSAFVLWSYWSLRYKSYFKSV